MKPKLRAETHRQQQGLANYCRSGKAPSLVGLTDGRLHHYRRLTFNIVKDALTRTYPLSVSLLLDEQWEILCHNFFEHHSCQSPQVWKMPEELISYVESGQTQLVKSYPHLLELMRFEWKEVEYYMMPDRPIPASSTGHFWFDPWIFHPEHEVLALEYPVHTKTSNQISDKDKGQYHCLIFRHPESGKVRFLNLNPFLAWMIETVKTERVSIEALFPTIRSMFGISDSELLRHKAESFFMKLKDSGVII